MGIDMDHSMNSTAPKIKDIEFVLSYQLLIISESKIHPPKILQAATTLVRISPQFHHSSTMNADDNI
jgi:hypothetical protein